MKGSPPRNAPRAWPRLTLGQMLLNSTWWVRGLTSRAGVGEGPVFRWASLRDLEGPGFQESFAALEASQRRFVQAQERVKAAPYRWPFDPLYHWSRRAEYPFVVRALPERPGARVLDAGSGVTFFPIHLVQQRGLRVECLDYDPVQPERLRQTCEVLGVQPPIPFHQADLTRPLSFPSGSFDAVLCISVVEHLPPATRVAALGELWRLVAPGGRLILTLDVSLAGDAEGLWPADVPTFQNRMRGVVGWLPSAGRPPADLLTPQHPGYGLVPVSGAFGPGNAEQIIPAGPEGLAFGRRELPLPAFAELACILCCIPKRR